MGGNGSYSESMRRVPTEKRTHVSIEGHTICGHKILFTWKDPQHTHIPMNCNTANRTYIIAFNLQGEARISKIAFYEGHHISKTIDLKFDSKGNIIPYSYGAKGTSHAHQWIELSPGCWGRKAGDKANHLPFELDVKMAKSIVEFNNKHYKYDGLTLHKES